MSIFPRKSTRRRRRFSMAHEAFQQEFALESLKSDRLRVSILIGALASALLIVLAMVVFFLDQFQAAFHGKFGTFLAALFVFLGLNLVYLIAEWIVLGRLIRKRLKSFTSLKYLSALVETSIPTAGIIIGSLFLGPIYTLFTPATLIYPVFISLSALRLNVRLCIFTGAVAGLEYTLLAIYLIRSRRA